MATIPPPAPRPDGAIGVETVGMTKRFGGFTALDDVSILVPPGGFHALLGENGAGNDIATLELAGDRTLASTTDPPRRSARIV